MSSTHLPTSPLAAAAPEMTGSQLPARAAAFAALGLTLFLLSRGTVAAYYAFTDSFVAPIVLSPDSDSVIQSRMNLNRLIAERQNVADRIEEIRADVAIDDDASRLLTALLESGGARELHVATRGQRADIEGMLATTDRYLAAVEDDVAAGLTHRADLERQELARHQMKASLLQNTRDQLSVREQVTRLELELLRVRVDRRIKELQLRSNQEALTRMNELLAQMQERPIFRAVEKSQNVAFVSYKEVDGVAPGAVVYRCKVWGYLDCSEVGKVADVLPGEVTAVDPWGTSARGQYATLDLSDASAARARSLRVRHGNSSFLARARTQAQTPRG